MTLLIAPLVEEGIFRRGIYAVFRRWLGVTPAAFLSALAFGLYHGNWIQGIYGFVLGCFLPGDMRAVLWKVQDGCADAWGCQWGGGALQYGFSGLF